MPIREISCGEGEEEKKSFLQFVQTWKAFSFFVVCIYLSENCEKIKERMKWDWNYISSRKWNLHNSRKIIRELFWFGLSGFFIFNVAFLATWRVFLKSNRNDSNKTSPGTKTTISKIFRPFPSFPNQVFSWNWHFTTHTTSAVALLIQLK